MNVTVNLHVMTKLRELMTSMQCTVKGHKYSSLSQKMRETFTPITHTVNRKTACRARVFGQ